MSQTDARIRDFVETRAQPAVVRLQDLESEQVEWLSECFVLTAEVRGRLEVVSRLLAGRLGSGVFLLGQYGAGRSHLLAYLAQSLGRLLPDPPDLTPISLVNFNASNRLEDIVCAALGMEAQTGDRRPLWNALLARHPKGLLLLVDELSEFLRSKSDPQTFNEDIRFLQFLGEWVQDRPCWLVAAMQEGIEHAGELEYDLYRKIKDRYPLRLLLTPRFEPFWGLAHVKARREGRLRGGTRSHRDRGTGPRIAVMYDHEIQTPVCKPQVACTESTPCS